MSQKNCPFCQLDDRALKENASARVILSNPRKTPGHLLVVPKRHIEEPWQLTKEELSDVYDLIWEYQQKVIATKLGDGADVRQNYRPFQAQSDLKRDHVHFHIIPRSLYDYIYTVSEKYDTELFADLDNSERTAVTKLLK